jgi:hypothetical protein
MDYYSTNKYIRNTSWYDQLQDADTWLFENTKLEVEIDESQITRKKTRTYLEDTTRQELYEER